MNERLYKLLHERNALQRFIARKFLFDGLQRLGFHLTGNHFYDLVPDTRRMAATYRDEPRELPGVDWRLEAGGQHAARLLRDYGGEFATEHSRFGYTPDNHYFRGLDALMLYVVLRDLKPARMLEVGQGFSTRIALAALARNARETGAECEFISLDPYPRLAAAPAASGVRLQLLRQELQQADLAPLLAGCQFVFVDSSHVFKYGSDVQFQFARLYPAVAPGAWVHVHDIFSPYEYPLVSAVQRKQFWNEQYFLENFLAFNGSFEVCLPLNLLIRQSALLREGVRALSLAPGPAYEGSSFYFQRRQP